MKKLDVMDIQEPPPPEEPPPPPPPDNNLPPPPPMVIPRSIIPPVAPTNVVRDSTPVPPRVAPPIVIPPVVSAPPPPATPDRSRPARARGNESSWVTTDDYPSSAQREGAEGVTGTRLAVSADGRVTNCDVTSSSGNSALDQAACRNLIRRGRYEPALDRDGNPTTYTVTKRVRWQLPDE
ncbi:MAG: TonB family protein [Sphingopyxis sp.]